VSITLAPASPADCADVARAVDGLDLLTRYGMDAARLGANLTAALLRGEQVVVARASEDGALVGFAWFLERGTFASGAYLRLIAVAPAAQSRSVGAALLAHVERACQAHTSTLFLLVSDFNTRAQQFYARHGYAQSGRLPDFVIPGVAELIFWKRLARPA
jgi:ribosomal protein S18 acetylase RimI-like enzyme